jgi:hypothetical protein
MLKRVQLLIGVVCVFVSWNASASSLDTLKKKFHMESVSSSTAPASTPPQCTTNTDCSDHGTCTDGQCVCDHGYLTVDGYGNCGYDQKSWGGAFAGAWFSFTGAANWYLGRFGEAAGQLGTTVVTAVLSGISGCKENQSTGKNFALALSTLGFGVLFSWTVADLIRIGTNSVTDGNDQPLAK